MRPILCIIFVSFVSAEIFQLRIIHTNDLSFQLDELSENGGICKNVTEPTTSAETTATTPVETTTTTTPAGTTATTPAETTATIPAETTTATPAETTATTPAETTATIPAETTTATPAETTATTPAETTTATPAETTTTTLAETTTATPAETTKSLMDRDEIKTRINEILCYGGVPRIVKQVSELRSHLLYDSLYIDAGGIIRANQIFQLAKSETAGNTAKILKPDIVVPSVEDFKQGFVESMKFFAGVRENNITVLAANLKAFDSNGGDISFEASRIYEFNDVKVGVVGFVSKDAKNFLPANATVEDPADAILREITGLQRQEVFVIIVAGSATISEAKILLNRFKEIDVIVSGGGDSYFMYNTSIESVTDPVDDPYPYRLDDGIRHPQFAVQVPHKGKYLGNLELLIDPEIGKVISTQSSNPIYMNSCIEKDADAEKYVREVLNEIETLLQKRMAVLEYKISAHNCNIGECTAGNCMTEAVWEYLLQEEKVMEKPAVAFWQSFLMTGETKEGEVNLDEIFKMYPTSTIIGLAKLRGSELKQFLEISLNNNGTGNYLQFYGARVIYELAQPEGKKVKEISILKNDGELHYAPLTEEESVIVAVNGEIFHSDPYKNLLEGKGELLQFYSKS